MIGDLVKNICTNLRHSFFYFCSERITENTFDAITQHLGDTFETKLVKVSPCPTKFYHNPKPFGLHTDTFKAEIICLYCIDAGFMPVATKIADVRDMFDYFSFGELTELKEKVLFNDPYLETDKTIPFLSGSKDNYEIFYSDWLCSGQKTLCQSDIGKKLISYIRMKSQTTFGRPLLRGESLFILNKKVLHGRHAIKPSSTRCLKRVWINNLKKDL